jgi:hypothetical protein
MTPEDIEQLFHSGKHPQGSKTVYDGEADSISDQEKNFRVQQLRQVLAVARDAWASGSEDLDLLVEKLAVGSRDGWLLY